MCWERKDILILEERKYGEGEIEEEEKGIIHKNCEFSRMKNFNNLILKMKREKECIERGRKRKIGKEENQRRDELLIKRKNCSGKGRSSFII